MPVLRCRDLKNDEIKDEIQEEIPNGNQMGELQGNFLEQAERAEA